MKKIKKCPFILILALCVSGASLLSAQAFAADFDLGVEAWLNGDYAAALAEFEPLAKQGDPASQRNLGYMYKDGLGVTQDYAEAARWGRLAAEQGDSAAQFLLGNMYYYGTGVLLDYTEAVRWYRLAAAQADSGAYYSLAVMYYFGQGVPQDYARAYVLFNAAATYGYADAYRDRDILAKEMTPSQIEQAIEISRNCPNANYAEC